MWWRSGSWDWRDYAGSSGCILNGITSIFSRGRQRRTWDGHVIRAVGGEKAIWCGHEPSNEDASRSWKRQGNGFSSRVPGVSRAQVPPWFWPSESQFGFLISRIIRIKVLFWGAQFVVIWYGSPRKLIYQSWAPLPQHQRTGKPLGIGNQLNLH